MRLASQQHQHKAGNLQHEAGINNNISTKLKIFSTRMASQQHQHELEIFSTTGINNINTKLEIFSTRLASTTFCGTLTDPKDLPRNQKDSLRYEILIELPHGTLTDPKDLPRNHKIP
jgi:hypothetical protein